MKKPKISVYVPSRNYGRFLRQALASVFSQTMSSWELIIFDEGSTDDTLIIANEFAQRNPKWVKVIRHQEPLGLRACANIATDIARGEYIIRLDADDYLDENAFLVLSHYLDCHRNVGLVYPNWIYIDENGEPLGIERRKSVWEEAEVLDLPAHGACTMIRKRVLKAVGGYDPQFSAQDGHEIWLKALHRFRVGNVQTPLFYYRKHETSMSGSRAEMLAARREIKNKAASNYSGSVKPRIAAVIPVKNSYEKLPNIALKHLVDKPLIDYTLDSVVQSGLFSTVFVTTDDPAVVEHCNRRGDVTVFLREMRLSDPRIYLSEVVEQAVVTMEEEFDIFPDIVAIFSIHSPLRKREYIQEALDTLLVYEVDQVMSIYEDLKLHFQHGKSGLEPFNAAVLKTLRLEREALFVWNGAVHVLWRDVLTSDTLYSGRIGHIVMPKIDSMQVKYPEERELVSHLLQCRKQKMV